MAGVEAAEQQNALISVFDKTGIEDFAEGLVDLDWQVIASGGTYKKITDAHIPAVDVGDFVGGGAILGHKVVTLSREVAGGLLAERRSAAEMEEMRKLGMPIIGLLCQDSYPLEAEIADPKATPASILAQSDIGGPTMLREAAKGGRILFDHSLDLRDVIEAAQTGRIVLSVPEQRELVLEWLRAGRPHEAEFVNRLANRAVYEAGRYGLIEAKYWLGSEMVGFIALKHSNTKYGENPQQEEAAFYADNRVNIDPLGLDQFEHVQGMEKGYVGMTDLDRLLQTTTHIAAGFERNFGKVPAMAAGVKHGNACGAGIAETHAEAAKKMLEGDDRAIFGGVVMINGVIDKEVAEVLMSHMMEGDNKRILDGVIGAGVTDEALEMLSRKKLRVVVNPALGNLGETSLDTNRRMRPVRGGMLAQPNYTFVQDLSAEHMEQHGEITEQQKRDMILGWAVGSTSNSNTITLVKDGMVIGNGVGQQDRVGAGQLAILRTSTKLPRFRRRGGKLFMTTELDAQKLDGAVAYSDSFFPFPDGPMILAKAGVKAILTSSGSVGDKQVIDTLTKAGVAVMMVPDKIGRGFYGH